MHLKNRAKCAPVYRAFVTFLNRRYPIPKAKVEIELLDDVEDLPFTLNGRTVMANALFSNYRGVSLIKVAMANRQRDEKENLNTIAHEVRHAYQCHVQKLQFIQAADYNYFLDPKELDAMRFARRVVAEFLAEWGEKTG